MNIDNNRTEKTRNWKIPEKFLNLDFVNFLANINVIEVCGKKIDKIPIKDAFGSIDEWANHFQLWEIHGIDLDSILKLFSDKGCAKISKRDNYIQHHIQNIMYLQKEIEARI